MNILIVDDSRFLRMTNERALTRVGHNVICASDGEEGLRLALERKPDLVVLDMLLGLGMLMVVFDESRLHTRRLATLNALTASIARAGQQGPMAATALKELKVAPGVTPGLGVGVVAPTGPPWST